MLVELKLTGATQVTQAFKQMGTEIDALNRKLDNLIAKLQQASGASIQGISISSVKVGSSSSSNSSVGAGSTPKPIKPPPVVPPPKIKPPKPMDLGGFANTAINGGDLYARARAINPMLGAAVLAASALIAVAEASEKVVRSIREYGDFAFNARGGSSAVGLAGISAATGVSLSEASGLASSRPGGAAQLNREIDQLRNIKDDDVAARFAKARGLEGYRSVRNLTDKEYEQAQNVDRVGPAQIRAADRAVAEFNISISNLATKIETAAIPVIQFYANELSSIIDIMNFGIDNSPLYQFLKWLAGAMNGGNNNPADKMNQAADKMNEAAGKLSNAVYGGGERTTKAFPTAWGWYADKSAINNNIRNLGSVI